MAQFSAKKVVAALPGTLDADTVYFVRAGAGFDLYVSDSTGAIAHSINAPTPDPITTVFNYTGAWQEYQVPAGAKSLEITAIGPGGRGGSGFSRAAGNPGGGGGGGGGGGITTLEILTSKLKQSSVFVYPGVESGGNVTYVSLANGDVSTPATLCRASAGANGGNGTATAVGAAGAAGVITTAAMQAAAQLGRASPVIGQTGTAGGSFNGGNGAALSFGAVGGLTSGGTGGGGAATANSSGGQIQNTGPIVAPMSGGASGGGRGNDGQAYDDRFMWTGATGGGSNNTGTGGRGGDGAIGSGGGGGGAGVTGGGGGLGGNGLVIITAIF